MVTMVGTSEYFLPVTAETGLTKRYRARVGSLPQQAVLGSYPPKKEQTMKTKTFLSSSLAGLAVSVFAASMPALAHDGYFYGHGRYGRPHFVYPGQRVVIVRPPVFVHRPVGVYYPQPWGTIGGAIAGAAIGGAVGDGRPGAIAAGSVIGAMVGNGLSR